MNVRVIATGLPRTGTSSLKAALQEIGYGPCQHMENLFNTPRLVGLWIELFETGTTDFNALLEGFQSTSDFPGCLHYQKLMEVHPDAKIILNQRDPEQWYESIVKTIYAVVPRTEEEKANLNEKAKQSPKFAGMAKGLKFVDDYLLSGFLGGNILDKDDAIKRYLAHEAEVKAFVPADRLLELPLGAGWKPLCEFLDVPVPTSEYPFKNKRNDFLKQLGGAIKGGGDLTIK
jgi:hypothetical protein